MLHILNMARHDKLLMVITYCIMLVLCLACKCSAPEHRESPFENAGFVLLEDMVDGVKVNAIRAPNGLIIYCQSTNVAVWFGTNGSIGVSFDAKTLHPKSIMLEVPTSKDTARQGVLDFNADGIPEKRRVVGSHAPEYFYKGAWYPKDIGAGEKDAIRFDRKSIVLRHDGTFWREALPEQ